MRSEPAVAFRVPQEVDDLLQLLLRLVHAGDVGESHFSIVLDVDFGTALADRHEAAGALAEAPDDEHP